MLRHQVRHFVIRRNSLQQELPFLQPFLCPHVSDLQVLEPTCACPADDPAASTAAAPHSRNHPVTRLGQEVTRLHSTRGQRLRRRSVERMTSEDLCFSCGRAFPLLVACPVAVTEHIQVLRHTLLGVDPLGPRNPCRQSLELRQRRRLQNDATVLVAYNVSGLIPVRSGRRLSRSHRASVLFLAESQQCASCKEYLPSSSASAAPPIGATITGFSDVSMPRASGSQKCPFCRFMLSFLTAG